MRRITGACFQLVTAGGLVFPGLVFASDWQLRADAGLRHSHWQERTEQGRSLLHERGTLHGLALGAQRTRAQEGLRLSLQWQAWGVRRAYDGQTNQGQPAQTVTDLREQIGVLGLELPARSGWRVGLGLSPHRVRRGLRGIPGAAGYEESWRWTDALATLGWSAEAGLLQGTSLQAAWGRPLAVRMRATLPGADEVTVAPRGHDTVTLGLELQRAGLGAWCASCAWRLGLQGQQTRFAASESVPLTRGGATVGVVSQPRTRTRDVVWSAGVSMPWP